MFRAELLASALGIKDATTKHKLFDAEIASHGAPCVRDDNIPECRPDSKMGGPYCSRAFSSGVCFPCFIPGVARSPLAVQRCPLDILKSKEYVDRVKFPWPVCKSRKPKDGCCLYTQNCEGNANPAKA